jgi:hypothetical protein
METFIIENNVPMPAERSYVKSGITTVLKKLEVGQSFAVHSEGRKKSGALYQVGKKLGRKFTARKTSDGIRIWRVS